MKKILCMLFTLLMIFSSSVYSSDYTKKPIYSSDIAVLINGTPVNCYVIDNKACVVAEEFLNHGFYGIF